LIPTALPASASSPGVPRDRVRPGRRGFAVAAALCCLVTARPHSVSAQAAIGVDLDWNGNYVWRGLVRSNGQVLQGGLFAQVGLGAVSLSGGSWTSLQLSSAEPGDWNDGGAGRLGWTELDWWGEVGVVTEPLDLRLGLVHYDYGGRDAVARRTTNDDTQELYARLTGSRLPLTPSAVAWWDVTRAKGGFVEGSLTAPLPLVPMFANLDVIATAGASLGQERDPADASETFVAERRGVTYVGLALAANLASGPVTARMTLHAQLNLDDATRRVSITRSSRRLVWMGIGLGYARRMGRGR